MPCLFQARIIGLLIPLINLNKETVTKIQTLSIQTLLAIFSVVILFHISILLGLLPMEITWGGRLKTREDMFVFEFISISVVLGMIITLLIKGNYLKVKISEKIINGILWACLIIFLLNTVGNFFAKTWIEKSFSLVTLFFSYLFWIILRNKN
jgi:hypothetical protein